MYSDLHFCNSFLHLASLSICIHRELRAFYIFSSRWYRCSLSALFFLPLPILGLFYKAFRLSYTIPSPNHMSHPLYLSSYILPTLWHTHSFPQYPNKSSKPLLTSTPVHPLHSPPLSQTSLRPTPHSRPRTWGFPKTPRSTQETRSRTRFSWGVTPESRFGKCKYKWRKRFTSDSSICIWIRVTIARVGHEDMRRHERITRLG